MIWCPPQTQLKRRAMQLIRFSNVWVCESLQWIYLYSCVEFQFSFILCLPFSINLLISFTNHIWTEAINYETHPTLHTHFLNGKQQHQHHHHNTRRHSIWSYTHRCHSTGQNSFENVIFMCFKNILRTKIHLVLSIYVDSSMLRALSRDHGFDFFFCSPKKNWRLFVINLLVRYLK